MILAHPMPIGLTCRQLDRVYPLPNETVSLENAAKLRHWDVLDLPEFALWREIRRVEARLTFDDRPHPWFHERRERLLAEQRRRAGAVRQ